MQSKAKASGSDSNPRRLPPHSDKSDYLPKMLLSIWVRSRSEQCPEAENHLEYHGIAISHSLDFRKTSFFLATSPFRSIS